MYIYIVGHMDTYVHMHMDVHMYIYYRTYVKRYMYVYMHMCIYVHAYTLVILQTGTYHTCIYLYVRVFFDPLMSNLGEYCGGLHYYFFDYAYSSFRIFKLFLRVLSFPVLKMSLGV